MRTGIILGKQEVCFASVNANVAFNVLGVCFYKIYDSLYDHPTSFELVFYLFYGVASTSTTSQEEKVKSYVTTLIKYTWYQRWIIVHVTTCVYWRFENPVQKLIFHCRYSSQAFTVLGCHYCQLQASLWMCICWSIWGTFISRSQAVIHTDFCYNTIFFFCGVGMFIVVVIICWSKVPNSVTHLSHPYLSVGCLGVDLRDMCL